MFDIPALLERLLVSSINRRRDVKRKSAPTQPINALGLELSSSGETIGWSLNPEVRLKHVYVLGSTGSGKTNVLLQLVEKDIQDGRTTVVLDMRGDLIDALLRCAAEQEVGD